MDLIDIKSLSFEELQEKFLRNGYKKFRAGQVYNWLKKGVRTFNDMTNLSKDFRNELNSNFFILNLKIIKKFESAVDGTIRYIFASHDNCLIETVLMRYKYGYSICISTQVGCKMNCLFCATGKSGFTRNLYPSEMISQIQEVQLDNNIRISNVVLMGMGEPLDNYENVIKFLDLVTSTYGLNIGMRHISVSTCGVVDKIYALADKKLQLTLSLSLHAPNDVIRCKIVPTNNVWNVDNIIKACKYYVDNTNRRISIEYIMIDNLNDQNTHAKELSLLLKGLLCHVNLIPMNSIAEVNLKKSNNIHNFQKILLNNGINTTVRRTLGPDINASCGQLRGAHTT